MPSSGDGVHSDGCSCRATRQQSTSTISCGTMQTALGHRPNIMSQSMKDRLIRKFEDEIAALNHELKLELPKEIKRARELGDLRENAEYQAAKERQRLVESRISMLQERVGK